ncbi:unnamed protein product, partial [Ectocarpus sp. 13 AM-2016]
SSIVGTPSLHPEHDTDPLHHQGIVISQLHQDKAVGSPRPRESVDHHPPALPPIGRGDAGVVLSAWAANAAAAAAITMVGPLVAREIPQPAPPAEVRRHVPAPGGTGEALP